MPAGEGAVRVPEHLRVVVGVEVDEAGGDVEAVRVEDLARVARRDAANFGDDPVLDGDVRAIPRHAGSVEDGAAANEPIVDRHGPPSRSFPRTNIRIAHRGEQAPAPAPPRCPIPPAPPSFYDCRRSYLPFPQANGDEI